MTFDSLEKLLTSEIYSLRQKEKSVLFDAAMRDVVTHHYNHCVPYRSLCDKRGFDISRPYRLEELLYLPASIFKDALLLSMPEEDVFRTISSSATTTGRPSRVALDKGTSRRQTKCFNKVVLERLGNKRRKFVVLDSADAIGRNRQVSARSSTIRSLLFCASSAETCIDDNNGRLEVNEEKLVELLSQAEKEDCGVVIFGFTYILYSLVVKKLLEKKVAFNLKGGKILHIGGWKKLESEKVTPEKLISDCVKVFGIDAGDVVDFYGFTEQSGMVYPTCESGVRHVPVWGEIVVRDPLSLKQVETGEQGLLQFITPIQTSYPGHSVLTEDLGTITGIDDCPCGRKGKTFKVIGRTEKAEVRGCGDIMAEKFA